MKIDLHEAYEAVFVGVLGRKPRPGEAAAWMNNNGAVTPVTSLAEALRTTDEYRDKVALESERMARSAHGRKVFFLHIPKSGGMSIRAQIRAGLGGVSPLLLSAGPLDYQIEPGATSWPFLTGHVGIDACPAGHSCVTVFREPRSRLLSLHRFVASRHYETWLCSLGLDSAVSRMWRENSIEAVIRAAPDKSPLGSRGLRFAWMFAEGSSTLSRFTALSRPERLSVIARGLQRVSHAAWIHDRAGIARLLEQTTGQRPGETGRLNVTRPTIPDSPGVIDKKTREFLADFLQDDLQVLEMASAAGLIPTLSADARDEIFRETAIKLGYIYE